MTKKKSHSKSKKMPSYSADSLALLLLSGFVLVGLGVLIFLATVVRLQGDIFLGLRSVCHGLAGALAPLLTVFFIWGGVLMILSTQRRANAKPFALAFLLFMLLLSCAELLTYTGTRSTAVPLLDYFSTQSYDRSYGAFLQKAYSFSSAGGIAGGWMGMILAWPLWRMIGPIPSAIACIVLGLADALFLARFDPKGALAFIRQRKDAHDARLAEQRSQEAEKERQWQQQQELAQQAEQERQQELARQAEQDALQSDTPQPIPEQNDPQDWQKYRKPVTEPVTGYSVQVSPSMSGAQPVPPDTYARPASYGFKPAAEESQAFSQPLEDAPKPRKSRILSGKTEPDAPARPRRKSIFGSGEEQEPTEQQQSPYSRPVERPSKILSQSGPMKPAPQEQPRSAPQEQPTVLDESGQPVRPWQARTTSNARVSATGAQKQVKPAAPSAQTAAQSAQQPLAQTAPQKAASAPGKPASIPEEDRPHARGGGQAAQPRPAKQQPKPSWTDDDTPPWEERPAPIAPENVRVPVVQQESPDGWLPELDLAPVKRGASTYGELVEDDTPPELPYIYPGLDLLSEPPEQTGISPEEDAMRAQRLEETLASFKVQATVRHITHGPAISRFELELAAGINVNRVTNLGANIAMNMEVKSVRIEAPIPGKSLVGIEVPNRKVSTVTLREVMESEAMSKAKSPLVVALGKDIAGTPVVCDLARMPHLLIAGATGSGKSVCINTMINSLLYRCSPKEVRLILVDPKVVELQCYNGIPHLLIPVVSDPHKAAGALAWAVGEMMDRYKKFQLKGVRAIDGYNAALTEDEEFMPRIVIIIDELADLMMTCKRDVEDHICRLAQLARAAGIHLVVATQRPSVDVITGLIKANIPSRIAFKVSSFIDSRTILDKNGAEQLLGWGDMLYQPTGEFTPIRVQGCFLSDNEVNNITDFIRSTCPSSYDPDVIEQLDQLERESNGAAPPDPAEQEADLAGDGSLLAQAIEMAVRDGQVSTSLIQRRLKIGYSRAGRLVDEMEKRGIVSAKDGAKPRMCLITMEDYEQMRQNNQL